MDYTLRISSAHQVMRTFDMLKNLEQPDNLDRKDIFRNFQDDVDANIALRRCSHSTDYIERILAGLVDIATLGYHQPFKTVTDEELAQYRLDASKLHELIKKGNLESMHRLLTSSRNAILSRNKGIINELSENQYFARAHSNFLRKQYKIRFYHTGEFTDDELLEEVLFRFCYIAIDGLALVDQLKNPAKEYPITQKAMRLARQLQQELEGIQGPKLFNEYLTQLIDPNSKRTRWRIPHTANEKRQLILRKLGRSLSNYFLISGTKKGRPSPDVVMDLLMLCGYEIDLRQANRLLAILDRKEI
ncbi:hypothetical protein [Zhongshania marina]|uniref:Uncharacterized protein n=1 Tax=Zhongshania marina TaxID=2304603 RepID=A0A2S4HJU9_9GAMM|nr:hypothetical protein [Marortus luteolus]POP54253.1 hypothetical protein C0068_03025 [Marortus luteolus]